MTTYFTIAELAKSNTADKYGINNKIPSEYVPNVVALIINVLNPLREVYSKPIRVNSGYRCPELNSHPLIKGSKNSDHLYGKAADITGGSKAENKKLFELAQKLNLPFKQLIDEKNFAWVHISYDSSAGDNPKRQVLKLK